MPGLSQRIMRLRERATRWRARGGRALAIIAPVIALAAATMPAAPALAAPAVPMAAAAVPGPPAGWSTVFSDDFSGAAGAGLGSQWMDDPGPGSNFGTREIETMTKSTSNRHLERVGH